MRTPVQPVHSSLVGCEAFGKCLIAVVLPIPASGIGSSEQQHDHAIDDYLPGGGPTTSFSFGFLFFFSPFFRHDTCFIPCFLAGLAEDQFRGRGGICRLWGGVRSPRGVPLRNNVERSR